MNNKYIDSNLPLYTTPFRFINREIILFWKFSASDLIDGILPVLIVSFTACIYHNKPLEQMPVLFLKSLLYGVLFTYIFCLINQVNSVDEDRLNKPDRPLVTKMTTRSETIRRIIIVGLIYILYSYFIGVLLYAIASLVVAVLLNLYGFSNHWFTKNVVGMSVGTFVLILASWHIVTPIKLLPIKVIDYMILISLHAGIAILLQDMRDQLGDKASNRKTLPLQYGEDKARYLLAFIYTIICPAILLACFLTQQSLESILANKLLRIILLLELLVHWFIAFRIIYFKTAKADAVTYIVFCVMYNLSFPLICLLH